MFFPACVLREALPEPGDKEKLPGALRLLTNLLLRLFATGLLWWKGTVSLINFTDAVKKYAQQFPTTFILKLKTCRDDGGR